ncbi:hypothetical protein HYPSUDRAFT_203024 [Hypholoma sublateritium FD-334 SS-4]|uniref:Uncharacterized protein n=1 Tax=Hypholoma sublateritium (strain FD-334 SS-4) TaxID=945553 RepID=A0A0D2PNJ7_HYPSF|nr:hypothetical protein HYPSUDRAFT_203024 [Hypholoma sublateritium FD-334 SS-4]
MGVPLTFFAACPRPPAHGQSRQNRTPSLSQRAPSRPPTMAYRSPTSGMHMHAHPSIARETDRYWARGVQPPGARECPGSTSTRTVRSPVATTHIHHI